MALTEAGSRIEIEDQSLSAARRASPRHRAPGADQLHGRTGQGRGCGAHRSRPLDRRTHQLDLVGGLDEALRRGEAFKNAGADMIFVYARNAKYIRKIGERLPPPLMQFAPADGFTEFPLKRARSAIASLVGQRVRRHDQSGAAVLCVPGAGQGRSVHGQGRRQCLHESCGSGLDKLVEIERRMDQGLTGSTVSRARRSMK